MAGRTLSFAVGTTLLGLGGCTQRTQADPGAGSKAAEKPPLERKAADPIVDDELEDLDDLEPVDELPPEPPGFHVNEGPVDSKPPTQAPRKPTIDPLTGKPIAAKPGAPEKGS